MDDLREFRTISPRLNRNRQVIKQIFDHCDGLILREIAIGQQEIRCLGVWFDSLVDYNLLQDNIPRPHELRPLSPPVIKGKTGHS